MRIFFYRRSATGRCKSDSQTFCSKCWNGICHNKNLRRVYISSHAGTFGCWIRTVSNQMQSSHRILGTLNRHLRIKHYVWNFIQDVDWIFNTYTPADESVWGPRVSLPQGLYLYRQLEYSITAMDALMIPWTNRSSATELTLKDAGRIQIKNRLVRDYSCRSAICHM